MLGYRVVTLVKGSDVEWLYDKLENNYNRWIGVVIGGLIHYIFDTGEVYIIEPSKN